MASQLDVLLHGDSINIVKDYGLHLKEIVKSKFGCNADFHHVGSSMNPGNRKPTSIVPDEKFSVVLQKGLKVSVWKADLTSFPVDAVVNAANDQLQHGGGLALALSNAGGPEFQRESDKYIKQKGKLKTGEAVVTNAGGTLKCSKIIHAVGPHLSPNPTKAMVSQAEPKLRKAVISILEQAEKHSLPSVAIPALSSGLFNFPLPVCADVMVSTLKEYHDKEFQPTKHVLREIKLVNHDDPSVREMQRACQTLASISKSYSHAAGSHGHAASTNKSYSQAAGSHGHAAPNASTTTLQVNNVTITLRKGRIEEQQTDVIVNTTSAYLSLYEGQISNAISQKAGYMMQTEINQYKSSSLQAPHVISTKAYDLQCKEVYHTLCANKRSVSSAPQILGTAILYCLSLAASSPHRSISFPAIGTGNLGFSSSEVAKIMTDEMVNFACKHQVKMEIHIVIFPSDNETFKAFEVRLRSHQGRTTDSPSSSSQGFEHSNVSRAHASGTASPQIRLTGTSDEATQEAKQWLEYLLFDSSGSIVVHNNFLQFFGEEEFQQLHHEAKQGVSMKEFFEKGCAGIVVNGESNADVRVGALLVESKLCKVQKDFVDEEVGLMPLTATPKVSYERKPYEKSSKEFRDRDKMFSVGLKVVRVDRVENPALKQLFDLKGKQLQSTKPRRMYQRIRVQFCNMVSHVGFQREIAPPDDPQYGDGIYFTGRVDEAMKVWKHLENEKYLYFVEAQVLTGKSDHGAPGLIVPPPIKDDPLVRFDSLSGGRDVSVIFNGHQALPEYIIICKKSQ